MTQLPQHHIGRPRLTRALADARLIVVEAGPGYGKSVLTAELAANWPGKVLWLQPHLASETLARSLDQPAPSPGDDPADLIAALADHDRALLLVFDDVDRMADSTLPASLARLLAPPHALVLIARRLPDELGPVTDYPGARAARGRDLCFTPAEVGALCHRLGQLVTTATVTDLHAATGGWPRAVADTLQSAVSAIDPPAALAASVSQRTPLRTLLQRSLSRLEEITREAVVQMAHLPLILPEVVDTATGVDNVIPDALDAGIPLTSAGGGRWELPGPAAALLRERAAADDLVAARAAGVYQSLGETPAALEMLVRCGQGTPAAALLADLGAEVADRLEWVALAPLLAALSDEALLTHPGAVLRLVRSAELAGADQERARLLERACRVLDQHQDQDWRRLVEAEIGRDAVATGRPEHARRLATPLLEESDNLGMRARVLDALARANIARGDDESLRSALRQLEQAVDAWRAIGEVGWAGQALVRAARIQLTMGEPDLAAARCVAARALLEGLPRLLARALIQHAEALVEVGDDESAEDLLGQALRIAAELGDRRLDTLAIWVRARAASQRDDRSVTLRCLRRASEADSAWRDRPVGAVLLADAAQMLDRVGEHALAAEYAHRASLHPLAPRQVVELAQAALEARSGDPEQAEVLLSSLEESPQIPARERWRIALLRAWAARRRGDARAEEHAVNAFERASALGRPDLPMVRERALAGELVALAAEGGSVAAARLAGIDLPVKISILGRFEVREGGRLMPLPSAMPRRLLKIIAAAGGRVHSEMVGEQLWASVPTDVGRARLRNVLSRLRGRLPEVVVRDGNMMRLHERVRVDAKQFEDRAQEALRVAGWDRERGTELAQAALRDYHGPLLPDDMYEPWSIEPRDRLRRLRVALLDLLADDAERRGDLETAVTLLETGIDDEPYREDRYVRAARCLIALGRHGAAAELVGRARAALRELDVQPGPQLPEIERILRGEQPDH